MSSPESWMQKRKTWRASPAGRESARRSNERRRQDGPKKDSDNQRRSQRRQRLRALIDNLKSGPCADCGGTFDPVCMDFDHRDGTKKSTDVSKLSGSSEKRLLEEASKCDVVCANCHRIRTYRLRDHRALTKSALESSGQEPQLDLMPPSDFGPRAAQRRRY